MKSETEIEKLIAENQRIKESLKSILLEFSDHFSEPWKVNKELSWEATPFAIEDIARVNFAGRAMREAKTEKEKNDAYLLRQIAVYIRTQENISTMAMSKIRKLIKSMDQNPKPILPGDLTGQNENQKR